MDGENGPVHRPTLTPPASTSFAPRVKTLKCSGCGSPLTVRGMEKTESIACEACGSILDLTDENLRIISTFESKIKNKPLIPLGSRGKIKGDLFEVIGFICRAVTVEGMDYPWSEYLLFNPYKGFRWLSEYNGHWNFLKTTMQTPQKKEGGDRPKVRYLDLTFLHFQTAEARVLYVLGEFYWKVEAGEKCQVSDYISPPLILSQEKTGQEVSWSIGEYIEPESIRNAFRLTTPLPPPIGVAPNQPSPYAGQSSLLLELLAYFCLAALLIHLAFSFLSQDELVYENQFVFQQGSKEKALVTDYFEVPGRTSNVVVKTKATVDNSWLYLNLALISEDGQAYDFGREISYYHGVEEGSRWSEGSTSDEAVLPAVPAGKYYLRIEPESSARIVNYTIQVYRDVPQWSFFFIALGALCILPMVVIWRSQRFESARWAESDHPR